MAQKICVKTALTSLTVNNNSIVSIPTTYYNLNTYINKIFLTSHYSKDPNSLLHFNVGNVPMKCFKLRDFLFVSIVVNLLVQFLNETKAFIKGKVK